LELFGIERLGERFRKVGLGGKKGGEPRGVAAEFGGACTVLREFIDTGEDDLGLVVRHFDFLDGIHAGSDEGFLPEVDGVVGALAEAFPETAEWIAFEMFVLKADLFLATAFTLVGIAGRDPGSAGFRLVLGDEGFVRYDGEEVDLLYSSVPSGSCTRLPS